MEKSKTIPRRFGQTFLLDNIKTEGINESQDIENVRPKISPEIPFMINPDPDPSLLTEKPFMINPDPNPSSLTEKQSVNESHHSLILDNQ